MTETNGHQLEPCALCGTPGVKTVLRTKLFGQGENAVVIDDVPLQQCNACHETYYEPTVSMMIDEILAAPEKYTRPRARQVASLAA